MLYLPGHITGVVGEMGSGKSFLSLLLGFQLAEQNQYEVCTNFAMDSYTLYDYFLANGYIWLLHCLMNGKIRVKPVVAGHKLLLKDWMDSSETLYILDEAGNFLNSRKFASTPPQFLADLGQIRHDRRRLIWIAQFSEQVDKQMRALTQSYIYCDSMTKHSKQLGSSKLLALKYKIFTAKNFKMFEEKILGKKTGIRYFFQSAGLALKSRFQRLNDVDKILFDVYPSLSRIEVGTRLYNDFSLSPEDKAVIELEESLQESLDEAASDEAYRERLKYKNFFVDGDCLNNESVSVEALSLSGNAC